MRRLAREKAQEGWSGDASCSDSWSSCCLGAQSASARAPHCFDLRTLRCATARPTRALGFATVRASLKRWIRFCPRRDGQQRTDSCAHSRNSRDDGAGGRIAGESASGDRGGRRSRKRESRQISQSKSRFAEVRCGGRFRYRNDRTRSADLKLRVARSDRARNQSDRPEGGFALWHFRWGGRKSDHRASAAFSYAARPPRSRCDRWFLRSR